MLWAKYPSDEDILSVGVEGLYVGNFFKWDPNEHTKLVQERYNWEAARATIRENLSNFFKLG